MKIVALLSAVTMSVLINAASVAFADDCPNVQVVTQVDSMKFYADAHGSVVDPEKLRLRNEKLKPLRDFVTEASKRVDGTDRAGQECAQNMLLAWAQGRAMTEEPADFSGQRDRELYTIAVNIIALKLQAGGFNINPLFGWLDELNHAVIADFDRRNIVDNLYVWSGVDAASYAALRNDALSKSYEDKVWSRAIVTIRPDGFVDSELRRAGRALLYHVYDLSALLTLQTFRKALGEPLTSDDQASLQRLVNRVGTSLCNPLEMSAATGGLPQDKVPPIELSAGVALAPTLINQDIRSCLPPNVPTSDPNLGGNLYKTGELLANTSYRK